MIIYTSILISGLVMIFWGILEMRHITSKGVLLAEKRPNLKRKQKRPLQGI